MLKIAYLTNHVPVYRTKFFSKLFSENRLDITVFCHSDSTDFFKEIPPHLRDKVIFCDTKLLFRGALVYENLPFRDILSNYDLIVSDGNPRHLGSALLSTIAVIFRRRVIIWSTLHSRRNNPFTQFIRLTWWRIFHGFFSYTEPDAAELRDRFPGKMVRSINNGLDQEAIDLAKKRYSKFEIQKFSSSLGLEDKFIGISLGRVIHGRFDLMAPVLRELRDRGVNFKWILLGEGAGMSSLESSLKQYEVLDLALFAGAVYDENEIARWLLIADVFVYPEAIGLSLYHAYGYGLPVITHSDYASHGPEMGVFQEGLTGLTFEKSNVKDMADKIVFLLNNEEVRHCMSRAANDIVRSKYNSDLMYHRFIQALLSTDEE